VQARTVQTSSATEFKKAPCKDFKNGVSVDVSGTLRIDGVVAASTVTKRES